MKPGEAVKTARSKAGMTGAALASRLGIDPSLMSRYENGRRKMPDDLLGRAAEIIGVDIREMLSEESPPHDNTKKPAAKCVHSHGGTIGSRLHDARTRAGIKRSDLAKVVGVTVSMIGRYENDTANLSAETLTRIVRMLGVSADELLGTYDVSRDAGVSISSEEMDVLSAFRSLDEHGKEVISLIYRSEMKRIERDTSFIAKRNAAETARGLRYIRKYEMASAAGYNAPLENEHYEMIPVDTNTPPDADFAVPISGNSMEPYIHDGDIIYVRSLEEGEELKNGDIGIFDVNGSPYCKHFFRDELGNIYLVSANESQKESNIMLSANGDSTFCAHGKVILKERPRLPKYFMDEFTRSLGAV